jgi:hypothetical protein
MSKLAINILTKLQQKNFDDINNEVNGIIANCICPGNTGITLLLIKKYKLKYYLFLQKTK